MNKKIPFLNLERFSRFGRVWIFLGFLLFCGIFAPTKVWAQITNQSVVYFDADGIKRTTPGNTTVYTATSPSSNTSPTFSSGWYSLRDIRSNNQIGMITIAANATVHIILEDNCDWTFGSGGIRVNSGSTLTIYSQSVGNGKLTATGSQYFAGIGGGGNNGQNAGTITINGGIIIATGGHGNGRGGGGAGIGGGGGFATGGSGGTVRINGGTITATGGNGAVGAGATCGGGVGGGHGGGGAGAGIGGGGGQGGEGENRGSGVRASKGGGGSIININGGNITAKGGNSSSGSAGVSGLFCAAGGGGGGGQGAGIGGGGGGGGGGGRKSTSSGFDGGSATNWNGGKGGNGRDGWNGEDGGTGGTRTINSSAVINGGGTGQVSVSFTYTVTFNQNGGSGASPTSRTLTNVVLTTPPTTAPMRNGFAFNNNHSWWTATSGGTQWIFTDRKVTANTTLYARWTSQPTAFVDFNQWDKKITVNWEFTNNQNWTGHWWVYRRQTEPTVGGWTLRNSSGVQVQNGYHQYLPYNDVDIEYGRKYEYQIVMVYDGSPPSPSTPPTTGTSVTTNVSTSLVVNTPLTAKGEASRIVVSFDAPSSLITGQNNASSYTIGRRVGNTGNFVTFPPLNFTGATKYIWHDNFNVPDPCNSYQYELRFNVFGVLYVFTSELARTTSELQFASGQSFQVSKGEYHNYIRLQWNVNLPPGGAAQTYRVFRRAANSNVPFVELETVTSNAPTVYWNDHNVLTGILYEYEVRSYQKCNNIETVLQERKDIGFTRAHGTVSGRVTYGMGTAVKGVNMIVRRNGLLDEENQYYSLNSTGYGQIFDFSSIKNIASTNQWTMQFWVRPNVTNTGSNIRIGTFGLVDLLMSAETDGYRIHLSANVNTDARSAIIPANRWSHITLIRNGNNWSIHTVIDTNPDDIQFNIKTFEHIITNDQIILTQGFDGGSTIPAGWTQQQVTGSTAWEFPLASTGTPATVQNGTRKARLYNATVNNIRKLVTPPMNLSEITKPILNFWHTQRISDAGNQDRLKIYYRTSATEDWIELAEYTENVHDWTERTIELPNPTATYYIAFEGDTRMGLGVQIDAITVRNGESFDFGRYFAGNIDDARFWNRVLDTAEIRRDYNRYLIGNENGLRGYWTFDENLYGYAFDNSRDGTVYNGNHAVSNTFAPDTIVPKEYQLALRGITDANGNYMINGIPFSGEGTSYSIIPILDHHSFNPTEQLRYISSSSMVHNGTDFTNISSFTVSGKVVYDGGSYPVADCTFEIDDIPVTMPNGQLVKSFADGTFTIEVPIGYHKVRVVKEGHTFVNEYLKDANGLDLYFSAPLNDIVFENNTRVKLIGHVVGGKREHEKLSGFGTRKNNIGSSIVTFTADKNYNLADESSENVFLHNTDNYWAKWAYPNNPGQDTTKMTVSGRSITLNVSETTGEFVAWVYPELYWIENISAGNYGVIYNSREPLDLSNTSAIDFRIYSWNDSTYVEPQGNVGAYWQKNEYSDTVRFHKEWGFYHQSNPTFKIMQYVDYEPVTYFGDKEIKINEDTTVDLVIFEEDETPNYLFGKPVFRQGEQYSFGFSAVEEYYNPFMETSVVNPDITNVEGNVSLLGSLIYSSYPVSIQLDPQVQQIFSFPIGITNLTTGIRELSATLHIGNYTCYSETFGQGGLQAYVLGGRTTGNDFLTAAGDEIDFILHDPPGSNSYAYIESGTSFSYTKTTSYNIDGNSFYGDSLILDHLNVGLEIASGLLNIFSLGMLESELSWNKKTEKIEFEMRVINNTTHTKKFTFTDRYKTSNEHDFVGHHADIFFGRATNILYGLTNNITIAKAGNFNSKDDILFPEDENVYDENDYVIGKQTGFGFKEDPFDTYFAYTGYQIEEIMIPKWKEAIRNLFNHDYDENTEPATITDPVYVSRLSPNNAFFGKRNDDPIFGDLATIDLDGPSYKLILPTELMEKMAAWWNPASEPMGTIMFTDSVVFYNDQIKKWEAFLAENEKRKVNAINNQKYTNNISFGSGVTIEKSMSAEFTDSEEIATSTKKNTYIYTENKIKILGMTFMDKTKLNESSIDEFGNSTQNETINSHLAGFVLETGGTTDQISVDYCFDYESFPPTYMFRTRGGRTSCPYEAEVRTKYYDPGMHIIMEGTMQIEVPKLAVSGGQLQLQVPSTSPASFILDLTNESETNGTGWFKLTVDESTNPYGAVLKIDGLPIGNGRYFMVQSGTVLKKTLTVEKGPNEDEYNNIRLILASDCDPVLSDDIFITVHFIPSCSEVSFKSPAENWVMNTITGDSIQIELENYDINYSNFGYIALEYRLKSSMQPKTVMKFYADAERYNSASEPKTLLGNEPTIKYKWYRGQEPEGEYEFRARTICETSDGIMAEYITLAVSGYVDMSPPRALGAPSPANGILGIGDELSITFNEDIQSGMLTYNNFSISGVLNAQEIAEPNVGLAFTGTQSAQTELPIFTSGSFSIETWFKRTSNNAGTLFAFGSNNTNISLGFNATGNAILAIGNETYTSSTAITNDETWKYIAMAYDRPTNSISVYKFEGSNPNNMLFTNKELTAIPETQGRLIVGNNFSNNSGFTGAVSQLHFYGINREETAITADKSVTKSGREYGLIGYWLMDEAEGNIATDKARFRHLTLLCDWYIYPSGYAKYTDGTNYFSIYTEEYPLNSFNDFTLEFWFRSETTNNQPNQTLFSADKGYIATNENGNLTLYNPDGTPISILNSQFSIFNSQWHHIVLSVKRGGSAKVYIDGVNTATFSETLLGNFRSNNFYFGAKRTSPNTFDNYFAGYFDEIRIWNSALTREGILLNKNSKLRGDEAGLQAYYPFETYIHQGGLGTNDNMAETDNFSVEGEVMDFTDIAASIKDVRPIENVPFTYVASNNKIVFTLAENYFARVEGTTLNITVKNVLDLRNNTSNTEPWTAFVKRNPLQWDTDPVYMKMQEGEMRTFTAKIVNVGGTNISYAIENLPSWLTVSSSVGNLQPLSNRELTFTVAQGVNIGNYETALGLTSGNGVTEILPVQLKVTGVRPDWDVNPHDFEHSMNITGQIQITGIFQEDPEDLLAAFIGNLCVGVTSPMYIKNNNAYYTFADIYGNTEHQGQSLNFKLWSASTGRIYPVIETSYLNSTINIVFAHSTLIGNTINPVIFNALDFSEQIIPLKNGWTWISTHLLNNNPSILNQMKTSLTDVGVAIKGRNGYIQQPGWAGTLTEVSEKSMYVINTTADHSLALTGVCANPATTPIPIISGWNWIGYIPTFTLPVESALAGLDAQAGDQMKGQVGYVTYTGAEWVGSLTFMQAGKGYMYYSGNNTPQEFTYPSTPTRGGMMPEDPDDDDDKNPDNPDNLNKILVQNHWTVDDSQYSSSMTITGMVLESHVALQSEQIEVGAFFGNECRGSAFLQYLPAMDHYICFLMIYGEGNETITLKVYDHATATEHTALNAPFVFSANLMFGTPAEPYIIAIGTDLTLSNLAVSEGILTPEFNKNIIHYTVDVPYNVASLSLTATPTDPNAIVTGIGFKPLLEGSNLFTVTVTAPDGIASHSYTVTVNRAQDMTVATLSDLAVSSGTLTPIFNSTTYNYMVYVPYSASSIILTATPTNPNATVTGAGSKTLSAGNNIFTITVTAQDGVTTQDYTVTVNRAQNNTNATLSNLSVSEGALTPMFSSNTYSYTVNVPFAVTSLTIAATTTDISATVAGTGPKNLNLGSNIFTITVTAADGITTQSYNVTVNRGLNTVATLSNLTVNSGTLTPIFSSNTFVYSVNVPYNVTAITLTTTKTDVNATVAGDGAKTLNVGANVFTITVTAQDGVTTQNYTVTVNRAQNNTVATLSNLSVSAGTLSPMFNSTTYSYTVNVPYSTATITLTATTTDPNAAIAGTGLKNLNVGNNLFTITVTATDGITTQNYNVTVNRGLNTVATLSNLTVNSGTLTPIFNSNTFAYSVNVPYSVTSITLTTTKTDVNAIVTGDGAKTLNVGTNVFVITVTAQDGVTTQNYTVTVNREQNNTIATLINLSVSEGTLSPIFNSVTYSYTVNVPFSVSSITLTATSTDPNATVEGTGVKTLSTGENLFTISVTAADGITVQEYTVTIIRALNTIATLSNLTVSTGTLTPTFNSNTFVYTVNVPYSVTSITLTATTTDVNATIAGDGVKTLNTGANVFTITVTAQDGAATQNYTVTVNRAQNNDATLSELTVSEGELSPAFNSTVYHYTIELLETETEITIAATPTDPMAKIFGDGTKNLSSGINFLTIVVIAEDGVTSLEYHITIERILGIDDPMAELEKILIYPNPTTGKLTIENGELRIEEVEVFDVYGRKLLSFESLMSPETTVDISHLAAGVYFVKIRTTSGEVVRKVVKE